MKRMDGYERKGKFRYKLSTLRRNPAGKVQGGGAGDPPGKQKLSSGLFRRGGAGAHGNVFSVLCPGWPVPGPEYFFLRHDSGPYALPADLLREIRKAALVHAVPRLRLCGNHVPGGHPAWHGGPAPGVCRFLCGPGADGAPAVYGPAHSHVYRHFPGLRRLCGDGGLGEGPGGPGGGSGKCVPLRQPQHGGLQLHDVPQMPAVFIRPGGQPPERGGPADGPAKPQFL